MMEREPKKPERVVTTRHTTRIDEKVYDVYKLIDIVKRENLPVESVPLETFKEHLSSEEGWTDSKGAKMGPKNIIELAQEQRKNWNAMILSRPTWADHVIRVRDADMQYPVLVHDKDTVLDGVHRLTKAYLDNQAEVDVQRFPEIPDEALEEET